MSDFSPMSSAEVSSEVEAGGERSRSGWSQEEVSGLETDLQPGRRCRKAGKGAVPFSSTCRHRRCLPNCSWPSWARARARASCFTSRKSPPGVETLRERRSNLSPKVSTVNKSSRHISSLTHTSLSLFFFRPGLFMLLKVEQLWHLLLISLLYSGFNLTCMELN